MARNSGLFDIQGMLAYNIGVAIPGSNAPASSAFGALGETPVLQDTNSVVQQGCVPPNMALSRQYVAMFRLIPH
jgi:hypothetical protein